MYYLTHRPQTIGDIDNTPVKERLVNILSGETVVHAFLFTGSKGTGKTSCARIVAKAINCENNKFAGAGKDFEPCNTCESCISITGGTSMDVLEMDAASNRKIDDMRDLLSKLQFAPVASRFKVYIIDEVHMLTTEAFNALLKSLEEPPSSTVFILATTDPEKMPKTVISRCIQISFGKAGSTDVFHMLKRITEKEKLTIDDEVLTYIATHSEDSFRDAAKILEELVTQKKLTIEGVNNIIGITWSEGDLLGALDKKDQDMAMKYLLNYTEHNGSFKKLIETLLQQLHRELLIKSNLLEGETSIYNFTVKDISKLMSLLQTAYGQQKVTPIESLPLEMAIVTFIQDARA